jgi:EmrB/QacA subfamily drug resistance transporter
MATSDDGTQGGSSGEASAGVHHEHRWWALVLLCSAFFLGVSDSTIVYTALPSIEEDLGFSGNGVQWVILAYTLTAGGFLLLGGRAADLLGRRRVFMAGLCLFLAMSLVCGLAWSGTVLVAARAVEGLASAIMVPAALSILMSTFPEGAERNKALGIWGALAGIGATAGLLLGGPLTDGPGWPWIFLVNLPVGLAVLAASPRLLTESRDPGAPRRFDTAGAVTITVALLAFVYAVVEAPDRGWTAPTTLGLLAASVALAGVFVGIEGRAPAPLVPLRLFRSRTLVGGNLVILAAGMAVDGLLFTFTVYTQDVLGYSAVQFGLAMAVMTVTSFAGVAIGQQVVTRVGFRPVAALGMGLIGAACLILTQVAADSRFFGVIFLGLVVFGPGMGAAFVAGQISALTGVDEDDSGLASGVEETAFAIGTALGVALLATVAASQGDVVDGTRAAFVGAACFAGLGLLSAVLLLRRPRRDDLDREADAPDLADPDPVVVDVR